MDEKLVATVQKIRQLANENQEFANEMKKIFAPSTDSSMSNNKKDIMAIRSALKICAEPSISYDFVLDQRVKDQLIIDNLRMENVLLDSKLSEYDKYYAFCVNGLYQIENIINYYLFVSYPNIKDLENYLTKMTTKNNTEIEDYSYKHSEKVKSIQDIELYFKINAICQELYPDQVAVVTMFSTWRKLRNQSEHRCNIIGMKKKISSYIESFYQFNTFNKLRESLKDLVYMIEQNLKVAKVVCTI